MGIREDRQKRQRSEYILALLSLSCFYFESVNLPCSSGKKIPWAKGKAFVGFRKISENMRSGEIFNFPPFIFITKVE